MNVNIRKSYASLLAKSLRPNTIVKDDDDSLVGAADFMVKDAMSTVMPPALEKRNAKLREDAQFLIFLLLKEMIVIPVLSAKTQNIAQVVEALHSDLRTIITNASIDESKEISGHSVLQSIESKWKDLKFSTFGIWH